MDYAKASALVEQHAPTLSIDEEVKGQAHVVVRHSKDGHPHSVMIPVSTEAMPQTEEQIQASFVGAVTAYAATKE